MINRSDWEEAVKDVRLDMLKHTQDPEFRREVASIIDAFADKLFEDLDVRGFMKKFNNKEE